MSRRDEAWIATRTRWEKRFLNADDNYTKWKVLEEVLAHVETLHDIETEKDKHGY